MAPPRYRTCIPKNARMVVKEHQQGKFKYSTANYFVGRRVVGSRTWDEDGRLSLESGVERGRRHGRSYEFYPSGAIQCLEHYWKGKMHGLCRQWNEDGQLLVSWRMKYGVGLDLWCDDMTGDLWEERLYAKRGQPSYMRFWNNGGETVHDELYYDAGGISIHRRWSRAGLLEVGYPQFSIEGRKVSKRTYLRRAADNPKLFPYRPQDDDPHRDLPLEFVRQRRRRASR